MKRRTLLAAATLAASLGLAAGAQAQTKWDLASAYPAFNFHSQNLVQFTKDVDEASNGVLKITAHTGASLFKAPEIKRAVQGGQAQAGEFFMVSFQNEWPIFGADGLPFLASSYEDAFKLYQAQKPLLEKKLDQQGMVLLYSVPWPPQGIYTKKPINSAADLKGLKWRVYSPTTARIGELVGAQPATIQEAELSQALATGVVEGLITSSATGADNKLYENLSYYYNVQAWIPKNAVVANKRAFNALDDAAKEALRKAAAAAEERGWKESQAVDAKSIETMRANGMKIEEPSEQLKADLAKVGETVLKEWSDKAGAEGKEMLDAYQASK
ncbi:C4-dicarboxylate ABC transporter substrate-binding protein [Corticibacter populi]|uniref:C4-dicarboxylate ABC transporter substrate-binding protein n=1 Tax=Corticibacter populi TaxID=1550736 RepID=A0A3M6QTY2_9BURK|nr:TRAP transporter substrate-binding protein [Corticibacter populi]RMX06487.1 C4-dicarboxylate ABC transporter substrate-binding protein [Corticibacter populi]RZS31954.1 TRAP-type C4-dicarboxylate transport system substrate-binding protein [Corticibacter populi]